MMNNNMNYDGAECIIVHDNNLSRLEKTMVKTLIGTGVDTIRFNAPGVKGLPVKVFSLKDFDNNEIYQCSHLKTSQRNPVTSDEIEAINNISSWVNLMSAFTDKILMGMRADV